MKKVMMLIAATIILFSLSACSGLSHCKECDDAVYKDGYCKYHYSKQALKDTIDSEAKGLFDKFFGD